MSRTTRALVVTGATGKQGGALIEALLANKSHPFTIYAVTRNQSSASAKSLAAKPNVHVIQGDFTDSAAIFKQVKSPWGLFSVTTPMGRGGATKEEAQGKAITAAALEADVQHIVFTSVNRGANSDTDPTYVPHFISKKNVEDDIKEKSNSRGTTWTMLRPVAFYENLTNDFMGRTFWGIWRQNGMDTRLQFVSTKDIGRVAADAFLNSSSSTYRNQAIALAGDDITPNEASKVFKEVTGQDIPSTYSVFPTAVKWMMKEELGKMFAWFKETGYNTDVQGLKKQYPFMKDFRGWLEKESAWRKH